MAWGAAAAAGITALGALANTGAGAAIQGHHMYRQYKYQKQLQLNQQKWLRKMSNTAHQREVADLRAAGLNPILSTGGTGATTPAAGMGAVGLANSDVDFGLAEATQNAISAYQTKLAKDKTENDIRNQTKKTNAEVAKVEQETKNLKWTKEGIAAGIAETIENALEGNETSANNYQLNTKAEIYKGDNSPKWAKSGADIIRALFAPVTAGMDKIEKKYLINPPKKGDIGPQWKQNRYNKKIIKTKYGDLEDIDEEIRNKYINNRPPVIYKKK